MSRESAQATPLESSDGRFIPEAGDLRRIAVAAELSPRTVRRWYEMPFRATWGNRARLTRAVTELGIRGPDPEPANGWSPGAGT